mgnify:CR=1 FL=1
MATFGENLDQAPGMAKRIDIHCGARLDPEMLAKPRLADQNLADQRFARGQIAVRLQPPATHDMPLAGLDQFANALEQRRLVLLYPPIQHRFIVIEDEAREFVAEIGGATESRQRLGRAFLPFPQPHGIKMRIADQVQLGWL